LIDLHPLRDTSLPQYFSFSSFLLSFDNRVGYRALLLP